MNPMNDGDLWNELRQGDKSALEKKLGNNALAQINAEASAHIVDMNRYSRILYENWKHSVLTN